MGPTLFFTFAEEGGRGGSNLKSTPSKIPQEKSISEIIKLFHIHFL